MERGLSKAGVQDNDPVNVAKLREIIDAVEPPHGLRNEVSDLVIIGWGLLRQRAWFQYGSPLPATPQPGKLQPAMELRAQPMPTAQEWDAARTVAGGIFGIEVGIYRTPAAVANLSNAVHGAVRRTLPDAAGLVQSLEDAANRLGSDGGPRLGLARRLSHALETLQHQSGVTLIQSLAKLDLEATPAEASASLAKAREVTTSLRNFDWTRLDPAFNAAKGDDERADAAQAILDRLTQGLRSHEQAQRAAVALKNAVDEMIAWLSAIVVVPGPTPPPVTLPTPSPNPGPISDPDVIPLPDLQNPYDRATGTWAGDNAHEAISRLEQFLQQHPGKRVEVTWKVIE